MDESQHLDTVRIKLWKYGLLGAASFLPPILAICVPFSLLEPYLPPDETVASWFQRSGALMVVIGLLSEFLLVSIQDYFDHNNTACCVPIDVPRSYKVTHKVIISFVALSIVIGTVIWGYGDILI